MQISKLSITFTLVIFITCKKQRQESPQYMNLIVVTDPTDKHLLKCDPIAVLKLYNLQEHKNKAAGFRYTEVGDLIRTSVIDIRLQDDYNNKKNNGPLFRERQIVKFYDSVKHMVTRANKQNDSTVGKNYSEVFGKICNELSFLKKVNSLYKGLLCFSNLAENSSILSVYSQDVATKLQEKPREIKSIFEKTKLLPDRLDSITVVFCYLPLNREDDKRFNAIANIYQQILSERGARVMIQADNTFYDLWPRAE